MRYFSNKGFFDALEETSMHCLWILIRNAMLEKKTMTIFTINIVVGQSRYLSILSHLTSGKFFIYILVIY